jgi:hypothetical protein
VRGRLRLDALRVGSLRGTTHNYPVTRFIFLGKYCVYIYIHIYIWVNPSDLTATSLGMMVSRRDYPQMTLFQVSELL